MDTPANIVPFRQRQVPENNVVMLASRRAGAMSGISIDTIMSAIKTPISSLIFRPKSPMAQNAFSENTPPPSIYCAPALAESDENTNFEAFIHEMCTRSFEAGTVRTFAPEFQQLLREKIMHTTKTSKEE